MSIKVPRISFSTLTSMLFILMVTGFIPTLSLAHSGATGVVKERMDMMDKIGKNMKAIKAMVRGKVSFDAVKLTEHAKSIQDDSLQIKKTFPKGSLHGPSEALPVIWENWDQFAALVDQLTQESKKLTNIIQTNNSQAIMKQFASVGKTCRSCHTDFRKKKDNE